MKTPLTDFFDLRMPVIQAPMAFVAGGQLAAAVSQAGGLGLIGGGYGDVDWIDQQFDLAADTRVGCGLISFVMQDRPELLDRVLARQPRALFLSFADPVPVLQQVRETQTPLICQVQTFRDACHLLDLGIEVIVAQGGEAGGHGQGRGTMAFVAEIADEIARRRTDTILCAAGGIADGRGLVAALALGAHGVVIGTRFWGAAESMTDRGLLAPTFTHSGDDTIRTRVVDTIRGIAWPKRYSGRVLKTDFIEDWHTDLAGLQQDLDAQMRRWNNGIKNTETDVVAPFVGEAIGLIHAEQPAKDILDDIASSARDPLLKLRKVHPPSSGQPF